MSARAASFKIDKSMLLVDPNDSANTETQFRNWAPRDYKLFFARNDKGEIVRFTAKFAIQYNELFKSWKVETNDGKIIPFPFVVEATLAHDNTVYFPMKPLAERNENYRIGEYWNIIAETISSDPQCLVFSNPNSRI